MTPRGIRNNNPLNIRISGNNWKGKCTTNTDGEFEQFTDIVYGIRAAMIIVRTYISRHQCNTPRSIISRWAPESDHNNVKAYVAYVWDHAGLAPDAPIGFSEKRKVVNLVYAMAQFECGVIISREHFAHAYDIV